MPATILTYDITVTEPVIITPGESPAPAAMKAFAYLFYNSGTGNAYVNGKLIPEGESYHLSAPTPGGRIDFTRLRVRFDDVVDGRIEVSTYLADNFTYMEVC
jgi:hypothetical protein